MMTTRTTEYLKYTFSEDEQRVNAQALARANRELAQLELRKKEVVSQLKAEADAKNADIARFSEFINNGYTFRDLDCEVRFDSPSEGLKTIYRIDTGEEVGVQKMAEFERQQMLDLK
jgi:hypothetical protein